MPVDHHYPRPSTPTPGRRSPARPPASGRTQRPCRGPSAGSRGQLLSRCRPTIQIGRLHEHGIAEALLQPLDRLVALAPRHSDVLDRWQAALAEQPLHDVLVHPRRRGQHACPNVGDVGQLQEPLHGAVLAKRAVQYRENYLYARRGPGFSRQRHRRFGRQRTSRLRRQQAHGLARRQPSALAGDGQRDDVVLLFVERLDDRGGRADRHLVLARAPAEQDGYSRL